jgi:hypothetical protein
MRCSLGLLMLFLVVSVACRSEKEFSVSLEPPQGCRLACPPSGPCPEFVDLVNKTKVARHDVHITIYCTDSRGNEEVTEERFVGEWKPGERTCIMRSPATEKTVVKIKRGWHTEKHVFY